MSYEFQEYPKWVNGRVINSQEEELNAEGVRENERFVYKGRDGREVSEEEGGKDLQLEKSGQAGDEKQQEEEKPVYPEKYLGIIIYENEVMNGGKWYRCCICRKELKYKQRFAKHKAMHDVHLGLKDISEVNFGFNKITKKENNDTSTVQDVSKELVEETG